jgi:hypothetical protein
MTSEMPVENEDAVVFLTATLVGDHCYYAWQNDRMVKTMREDRRLSGRALMHCRATSRMW